MIFRDKLGNLLDDLVYEFIKGREVFSEVFILHQFSIRAEFLIWFINPSLASNNQFPQHNFSSNVEPEQSHHQSS